MRDLQHDGAERVAAARVQALGRGADVRGEQERGGDVFERHDARGVVATEYGGAGSSGLRRVNRHQDSIQPSRETVGRVAQVLVYAEQPADRRHAAGVIHVRVRRDEAGEAQDPSVPSP